MNIKKAVFVIAFKNFRDEEYFQPKEVLERAGFEVITVSTEIGMAQGTEGGEVDITTTVDQIKIDEFDVIIFVGGQGMLKNVENKRVHHLAQQASKSGKLIGAICIAPIVLAKAGVLEGKKATVWASALDRRPVQALIEEGAIYENKPIVVDGKIVTASGPQVARQFGEKIVEISRS